MPDPGTVPIRPGTAADVPAVVALLSATLRADSVLGWLHPHASAQQLADAAAAAAVQAVAEAGADGIDVVSLGPGRVDGVAVWADHTTHAVTTPAMIRPTSGLAPEPGRTAALGLLLDVEHLLPPHHDLLHLVLGPALARRAGVVAQLLRPHHDRLDAAGLQAYAVVHRLAGRNLLLAQGWQDLRLLHPATCPPAWALRRAPNSGARAGHEPGA